MKKKTATKINIIGAKIDIIESINNALKCALIGEDCFTKKDAYNFVYLLENRIKDIKKRQDKLIEDLKI